MTEHLNPHNPYERNQADDKPESTQPKTSRLTHIKRGRGALYAAGLNASPFGQPKPERQKPVELTPEQIAGNATRMQEREDELRAEADERIAAAQNPETTDAAGTINIVGGKIYDGVEVGGLSAADQARVEAAANIGRDIADRVAEATAGSGAEDDDSQNDGITVTRDGTVIVRGAPNIGTIVGGQVHHYPR